MCDFSSATIPKHNIRANDFVVEKFAMNGGESFQNTDNSNRDIGKNDIIKVSNHNH